MKGVILMNKKENHILLEKAFVYSKQRKPLEPKGCYYNFMNGGWMKREEGREVFLVKSKDPNRSLAGTKKADLETGEDQKSE